MTGQNRPCGTCGQTPAAHSHVARPTLGKGSEPPVADRVSDRPRSGSERKHQILSSGFTIMLRQQNQRGCPTQAHDTLGAIRLFYMALAPVH
jgi:hypothetical protein